MCYPGTGISSDVTGSRRNPSSTSAWQFAQSSTHLRALRAGALDGARHAFTPEMEPLRCRVDVVELQHAETVAVATGDAATTRFVHQDLLHLAAPVGHRVDDAPRALVTRGTPRPLTWRLFSRKRLQANVAWPTDPRESA